VLEYLDDPGRLVDILHATLRPGGVVIILVPQNTNLYGMLDRSLGHKRRYSATEARRLLESHRFTVETIYNFNKVGTPPWWIYSKVAGSRKINKPVLKVFDKTVWLWRRLDALMPWNGLSLILVARKSAPTAGPQMECTLNQQTPASSN
jgi:hypothetical protein